ncbi:unnamed protein product [Amaranthus hypochondriacus]
MGLGTDCAMARGQRASRRENFRRAVLSGKLEDLGPLVEKDADLLIMEMDNDRNRPLHSVVENKFECVAKFLLNKKPEAALFLNNRNETPLYKAITMGQSSLVFYMLQSLGKDVDLNVGRSILHAALALQHPHWQEMLLKHQEKLMNCWDDVETGLSPLSWAIQRDNGLALAEYLLNNFPEVKNIPNRDNDSSYPIHKAWESGRLEIVRAFYVHHPNSILMTDRFNRTILHYAAAKPYNDEFCYKEMLSFLHKLPEISKLLNVPNIVNHTAVEVAVSEKNDLFLQYFRKESSSSSSSYPMSCPKAGIGRKNNGQSIPILPLQKGKSTNFTEKVRVGDNRTISTENKG